ncbi:MAG TPA: sulfatase-like hydrolase/transferase [Bryobacteraceae bacterium]|nr:sulfatase-like hydrolase/transferase [Bryobacteraceae bacterium]
MRRRDVLFALAGPVAQRPNIVFILVDDLRFDELHCTGHPFAETPHADRLAREGANFRNAFATTPLCSPSRASFLTGTYVHTNGVVDNVARDAHSHGLITWPRLLHEAGHATAFLGKWHMGNDDSPRPGFDRWVSFRGQGECNDPPLNIDGKSVATKGYVTDILTDHAVGFIEQPRSQPFCLYIAHKAVHPNVQQNDDGSVNPSAIDADDAFIPAERHQRLYEGRTPPRRGNYLKPPKGKPALERSLANVTALGPRTATSDKAILNRLRMAKAVDDSLGRVLAALERIGQLDRTLVIFTSDHGYFYGEHCLGPERRLAYEETIRIPMLVRYPRRFAAGSRPEQFVLSVDVAATALAVAGVAAPRPFHGRPFWAMPQRDAVLVEYFSDSVFPRIRTMGYSAIRTKRWKYIHYRELEGADELYDLQWDPFELENVIAKKGSPLTRLKARLNRLLAETGDSRTVAANRCHTSNPYGSFGSAMS